MKSGLFFYPGRKDTKKAAIYVKDIIRIMVEMVEKEPTRIHVNNTVYNPCYTIEEICKTMAIVTGVKKPKPTVPSSILKSIASLVIGVIKMSGNSFDGIHPDRVKNL